MFTALLVMFVQNSLSWLRYTVQATMYLSQVCDDKTCWTAARLQGFCFSKNGSLVKTL